ncbi:hypothetical protein ALC57_19038, partial [Trachymyrmex cornetzi]
TRRGRDKRDVMPPKERGTEAFFGLADAVPLRSIGAFSLSPPPPPSVPFILLPFPISPFSLFLSLSIYAFAPITPAWPIDITFSVRSEKHTVVLPHFLAPRWSHSLFLTTRSLFFCFSLPPCLSCQETFDFPSSSLFLSPNAHFLRSYLGSLSHLPPPSSPPPTISPYHCLYQNTSFFVRHVEACHSLSLPLALS